MYPKNIKAYIKTAQSFAEESTANNLKVGAVIVKDRRIVSHGYNGTPPGWDNQCEDEYGFTKPEVIHAEANAILKAAKHGESLEGSTLYITHSPCINCAKMIASCGINSVYYVHDYKSSDGLNFLRELKIQTVKVKEEDLL